MESKEIAHAAAVIASGLIREHKLAQINEEVMDSIAKVAVTLASKLERTARELKTRGGA